MLTVYLETNPLIAAATGQDADMDEVLHANGINLHLVVPEVCLMEALSVVESKRRERNVFAQNLNQQITQLRRDLTSTSSQNLLRLLEDALIENSKVLNDIESRLQVVLEKLQGFHSCQAAEVVSSSPHSRRQSLHSLRAPDPTDNFILCVIEEHAFQQREGQKILLSNDDGFDAPEPSTVLQHLGIRRCRKAKELRSFMRP